MNDIVVYTQPGCADCVNAKHVFAAEGVLFHEIDITENPGALTDIERICAEQGAKTKIPVILIPPPVNRVFIEPQGEELEELRLALQPFKPSASPETG